MLPAYDSVVVRTAAKILAPFIQVFGLYVVFHGAESPGGGFQGGAILAASFILLRLTAGPQISSAFMPGTWAVRLGATGVLIYALVGLAPLLWDQPFLDYDAVPLAGLKEAKVRAWGIEAVEIGVAVAVAGVMVSIFDDLATARRDGREREGI